jgi:hypothetical protein
VNKTFQGVIKLIEDGIEDMYKEGRIAGLAMQRETLFKMDDVGENILWMDHKMTLIGADMQDIKAELFRQRQQAYHQSYHLGLDVGNQMRQTLLSNFEEVTFKGQGVEFTFSE